MELKVEATEVQQSLQSYLMKVHIKAHPFAVTTALLTLAVQIARMIKLSKKDFTNFSGIVYDSVKEVTEKEKV